MSAALMKKFDLMKGICRGKEYDVRERYHDYLIMKGSETRTGAASGKHDQSRMLMWRT